MRSRNTETLPDLLTVEAVHRFSAFATAEGIRSALRSAHGCEPARLALEGLRFVFEGDVTTAVEYFARAIRRCDKSSDDRAYLVDLLVPYLSGACRFDEAEQYVESVISTPPQLAGCLQSLRATFEAARGHHSTSRRLAAEAVESARDGERVIYGRVLSRASVAAYYRREYQLAVELGLRTARLYESEGADCYAMMAYSVTLPILIDWAVDGERAQAIAERMMALAERAGNVTFSRYALGCLFTLAGELHDVEGHAKYRQLLMKRPLPQIFVESAQLAIAEAQGFVWARNFEAAVGALNLVDRTTVRDESEIGLLDAALAVIAVARGDIRTARELSRAAIANSARRKPTEQLCDRHNREKARLLAAATCFLIGDTARGRQALSSAFDPNGFYLKSLSADGIDENMVPPLFRGYASMINVAASAQRQHRADSDLSQAELDVLRLLPRAGTLASVASEMGKSPKTIQRQVESIYSKLGAKNRAQAIERAREAGILA